MNDKEFKAILEILIPRLVGIISEERVVTKDEALTLLYQSKLYARLECESTKLWRLSAQMLYDLLDEELRTGTITFPEEV
jgi:hypothetical protein